MTPLPSLFQLHHTGIKTKQGAVEVYSDDQFQLHHTGIKTLGLGRAGRSPVQFQLHHTGIKTSSLVWTLLKLEISIAPYRN